MSKSRRPEEDHRMYNDGLREELNRRDPQPPPVHPIKEAVKAQIKNSMTNQLDKIGLFIHEVRGEDGECPTPWEAECAAQQLLKKFSAIKRIHSMDVEIFEAMVEGVRNYDMYNPNRR